MFSHTAIDRPRNLVDCWSPDRRTKRMEDISWHDPSIHSHAHSNYGASLMTESKLATFELTLDYSVNVRTVS